MAIKEIPAQKKEGGEKYIRSLAYKIRLFRRDIITLIKQGDNEAAQKKIKEFKAYLNTIKTSYKPKDKGDELVYNKLIKEGTDFVNSFDKYLKDSSKPNYLAASKAASALKQLITAISTDYVKLKDNLVKQNISAMKEEHKKRESYAREKKSEQKEGEILTGSAVGTRERGAVVVTNKKVKEARKEKRRSDTIQKVKKQKSIVEKFCPECSKELKEFSKAMEEGGVKDALEIIKQIRKTYAERLKKKKPKVFAALDKIDKLLTGFVKDFGRDMAQNPERERKLNALAWRSNSFNDYIKAAHNQNLISDAVFQAAQTLIPTLPTATLTPQQVAKINKIVNAYIKQRSLKELAEIYGLLDDITHPGKDADLYYGQLRQKYQPVYAALEAGISAEELKKLIEEELKRRGQEHRQSKAYIELEVGVYEHLAI